MAALLALSGGARPQREGPQLLMLSPPRKPASSARLTHLATARESKRAQSGPAEDEEEEVPGAYDLAHKAWKALRSKRKRGQAVSEELVLLVLCTYFADVTSEAEGTHVDRIQHAVRVSSVSLPTVRKIVDHFLVYHELLIEDVSLRGGGSYTGFALPQGFQESVVAWVTDELNHEAGPQWVTLLGLQRHIFNTYGIQMSRQRICKLASSWGLDWGVVKKTPAGKCSPERMLLRQVYVLQLAAAVLRDDVIAFTDESFSNVNAHYNHTFFPSGEPHAQHAPTGVGERLCWVHALTVDGMLGQYYDIPSGDEDDPDYRFGGMVIPPLGDVTNEYATAEMMFAAKEGGNTGDYHGNFNHDIVMDWIRLRFIPALKVHNPEWFQWHAMPAKKKTRAAKPRGISAIFDCAPYHVGFHPDPACADDNRFDPLKTSRSELVTHLMRLGCVRLIVDHTLVTKGAEDEIIDLEVFINEEEKDRRGTNGKVARLPELQAAAHAWLVENSPETLMNDIEYELNNYGICVIWNASNYPQGDFVEYAWGQGKAYADAKHSKGRKMVELADHVHEGLYAAQEARPGMSNVKGGCFVLDPVTGVCESAKKIFEHGFHSLDKKNPGMQAIINADAALGGTFPNIICSSEVKERALKSHYRSCIRWMVRDTLELEMPLESDDEGSDDDSD